MTDYGEEIARYHRVIDSSLRRNLLIQRSALAGGILGLGAPISLLALHFSKPWAALAAIIAAALLLLFFLRRYGLFRGILKEDAARYMDETFSLKERAASRIELGESAPKDDRVNILDKQLSSLLPKAAEPPPLKIKKAAITSLILAPIPWIAFLWITLSEASEIKNSSEVSLIEELLKENKTMPDELKETLKDLSSALSKDDISSLSVKDALKRSEEALKDALEGKGSEPDSKTLEIESLPAETPSPTPSPSPTPKVEITPTPQSSSDKDKSSKDESRDSSKEESKGKKEESGSKGSSKQEKSGDGEEKDQKDGGQGKGGASESKSEGKDSKEGEGKGESDSKEESKSLEGVGQALKEIKEKSESEKEGKEGSKDGKDSEKPSDDQGKANDQKEGASDKKNEDSKGQKGEGKKGESKEKSDLEKNKPEEKGEGEKKDPSSQDKTESDKKEGGKDKEKAGEKGEGDKASSLPLGAEIVPTPQGNEGESDGGPKTLDEVAVPGEDETLDARFTGEEKERVKNEKGGEAKVSLSDVKLSKPDEASAEEGQYIPPEYSGILR